MRSALVILSSALVLISPIFYIYSIYRGQVRPHRTTRFVVFVITFVAVLSLVDDFGSAAFWLAAVSLLQTLATFLSSLKRGMGGWSRLDIMFGCGSSRGCGVANNR
jgi:hypothetical protein